MQLRLTRAITADRVDVDARADHVVGEDGRPALVGGAGRDDLGPENRLFAGPARDDADPCAAEVPRGFSRRDSIDVVEPHRFDSAERLERKRLEFRIARRRR